MRRLAECIAILRKKDYTNEKKMIAAVHKEGLGIEDRNTIPRPEQPQMQRGNWVRQRPKVTGMVCINCQQ